MYKKLLEASKAMHNPTLDAVGQVGKRTYKYASLASILKAVRPALLERGLVLTQGIAEGVIARLETRVIDAESGESTVLDSRYIPDNDDAQRFGSFETYMRRYALLSAFGLVGAEDDDGAMTVEPVEAKPTASQDAISAGHELGEAIAEYCRVTGSDVEKVRGDIRLKLAATGESRSADAVRREAEKLREAVFAIGVGR